MANAPLYDSASGVSDSGIYCETLQSHCARLPLCSLFDGRFEAVRSCQMLLPRRTQSGTATIIVFKKLILQN